MPDSDGLSDFPENPQLIWRLVAKGFPSPLSTRHFWGSMVPTVKVNRRRRRIWKGLMVVEWSPSPRSGRPPRHGRVTADLRRRYRRRRSMVLLSAILMVLLVLHVVVQDGRLSTVVSTARHAVTSVWRGSSPSGSKTASSAVESDSTDSDAADSDAGSSIAKASSVPTPRRRRT